MAEIKGTDIAYAGLTYGKLGEVLHDAVWPSQAGNWDYLVFKELYFNGLQAVFSAIQKEQEAKDKDKLS